MLGGGLGPPAAEHAGVPFCDLSSIAWSELPFPGGRSSLEAEAAPSLLRFLCGLQVWRSPGKTWVLVSWDVDTDVRATVSDRSQHRVPRRQSREGITRAISFSML